MPSFFNYQEYPGQLGPPAAVDVGQPNVLRGHCALSFFKDCICGTEVSHCLFCFDSFMQTGVLPPFLFAIKRSNTARVGNWGSLCAPIRRRVCVYTEAAVFLCTVGTGSRLGMSVSA